MLYTPEPLGAYQALGKMATSSRHSSGLPLLQAVHDQPAEHYLVGGELPQVEYSQQIRSYGDLDRELILRQAPMHARVAMGKEKDRKPVDPPPIIQLIDKRNDGRNGLYDSPYLFMSSSLVPENFDSQTKGPELPSNYLTGSLASSIHRLKDTVNTEGGFFVFGDLSVRHEGRFRLRFTLYEREEHEDSPCFRFISELITNTFTVYSPKNFPGMTESTFLTRTFSDQGVKLRLRKDSRTMTTRKRNRQPGMGPDSPLERPAKRTPYGHRHDAFGSYGAGSLGQSESLVGAPGMGMSQNFVTSGMPLAAMSSGAVPPPRTAGYYLQTFTPPSYY